VVKLEKRIIATIGNGKYFFIHLKNVDKVNSNGTFIPLKSLGCFKFVRNRITITFVVLPL
jgi:hypothetical protein